jgi:DUF4097 and DUF4098 domain-containing protein YvlB
VKGSTGGGNIRADACKAALRIDTGGGNIVINDFTGTSADAKTGGGSISADIAVQPKAACSFRTGGGNIRLNIITTVTANIDANTGGGRLRTDIPVTIKGEKRSTSLEGTINGGGPRLLLETGGGDISISNR